MRSSNVISYGLTLFFPLILPAIILVLGAGLSLTIPGGHTWPMVFILLSVTVVPIAVITGLYFLCSIFSLFGQRLMINYVGWLLLASGGIYLCMGALGLCMGALGGASMAAVEGAVTAIIIVLGASLSLAIPGGHTSWPMVFILLSVTVVSIAVITGLYFLCSIFSLFGQRLMINYVGWLLLASGGIYLCMGALGGASMAAVEGAVTASKFRAATQRETLNLLLCAQAVIIPLCVWGTRKTSRLFQAPGNTSVVGA